MSADEYNRMLFERMHTERRWENQPATGWTVDDLDPAEIRNTEGSAHIRVEIQHKGGPSLGVSPERSCGSG